MNFTTRLAVPRDAGELVRAHNLAWREAYGHLGPEEFFAVRDARLDEDVEDRRRQITDGVPWTVAVNDDGALVGLALAGPDQDPDRDGQELYFLYVLRRVYGFGVGQALLDEVIGDQPASLWVLEVNSRAIAFYVRNRFAPDGIRRKVKTEGSELQEIRMVRS